MNQGFLNTSKSSGYLPRLIKETGDDVFMAWLPLKGHSMTCNGPESIPDGSIVLVKDLGFKGGNDILDRILLIPLKEPLAIELQDQHGEIHFFAKTVTFIDVIDGRIRLTSYNRDYPDFWVPVTDIHRIYRIEKVMPSEFLSQLSKG